MLPNQLVFVKENKCISHVLKTKTGRRNLAQIIDIPHLYLEAEI
jgi:hypothetical protein